MTPPSQSSTTTTTIRRANNNNTNHNRKRSSIAVGHALALGLLASILSFYAGMTIGMSVSDSAAQTKACLMQMHQNSPEREELSSSQQAIESTTLDGQAQTVGDPSSFSSASAPIFPTTISDFVVSASTVPRDDFVSHLNLGIPLDPSSAHNERVLLLYNGKAAPDTSNNNNNKNNQQNDNTNNNNNTDAAMIPAYDSTADAVSSCDFVNLIFTDKSHHRAQCWAIMGQYEAFHVQKYMRVAVRRNDDNDDESNIGDYEAVGKVDATQPLRLVNRGYQSNGRKSLATPYLETTRTYWQTLLVPYLQNLSTVLEKLQPILQSAASYNNKKKKSSSSNSLIVMVCNHGQSELLLNFLCAAQSRQLDVSRVVIFATDMETYALVEALHTEAHVFYDEALFAEMPTHAAHRYADKTFMKVMMAKVWCVHLVLLSGYSVLFQDVDMIWFQHPLEDFFEKPEETKAFQQDHHNGQPQQLPFDVYFQDDGNHALFYAPYSPNTGFYYLRHNHRTLALINSLLLQGDSIITTKSHQIPLTFVLQEMASLHGLRVKIFDRLSNQFPGGHAFHRRKDFMKEIIAKKKQTQNGGAAAIATTENDPLIFHMSWTASKINKVKFFQQFGEWYLHDTCIAKTAPEIFAQHHLAKVDEDGTKMQALCCSAEALFQCHYKDKPSRDPCPDSPTIDKKGRSFW